MTRKTFAAAVLAVAFVWSAAAHAADNIIIAVESIILPELSAEVERLRSDLTNQGYSAKIRSWNIMTDGGAEQFWNYLKSEYSAAGSLHGVILVGNMPKARGSGGQYTDLAYWKMTAAYGNSVPPYQLWVSRMFALDRYGAQPIYGSEVTLLKRALDANHAYRTGASRLPHIVYHYDNAYPGRGYAGDMQKALEIWPAVEYLSPHLGFQRGGELIHEESHGSIYSYNEGQTSDASLHHFIAQARFANISSCSSGEFGGVVNNQLLTRGGGNVFSVGATTTTYAGYIILFDNYPADIAFRARLAAGDSWGKAFVASFPYWDYDRLVFYGDLSLKAKTAPPNQLPSLTDISASSVRGTAPLTVNFIGAAATDADGSIALYEWFPTGHDSGRATPALARSTPVLPASHTYTRAHRYSARVEVADNFQARARKELVIAVAPEPGKPLRINCGTDYAGPSYSNLTADAYWHPNLDYTDTAGNLWLHDQVFYQAGTPEAGSWGWICLPDSASNYYSYTTAEIANTTDDRLYQSWRYDGAGNGFAYKIPLPNGSYTVNFGFAEPSTAVLAGQRLADVTLEGVSVLQAFDIVAAAGTRTAVTVSRAAAVSDGELTIEFRTTAGSVEKALVNNIEIVPTVPGTPPVITSALAAAGQAWAPFNYTITATNSPTTFSASPLPAGLSLNISTGVISGAPVSAGTTRITLGATNSGGTGTATLVLTVIDTAPAAPGSFRIGDS